jgi:hypothetical protein
LEAVFAQNVKAEKEVTPMKWMTTDVDLYLQSTEYVDTVIVPLIPISIGKQMKNVVLFGEFITILSNEIERQFKGRVFLLPPYTYLTDNVLEEEFTRLEKWRESIKEKGFKHVLFLTSDEVWKRFESELGSSLILVQSVPLEHVESKYKQQIITDEVQAIVPLILKAWRN